MRKTQMVVENSVRLVDAKTLAKMLSASLRTVWRLRSAGKLPRPLTIGGSVRWRLSDIEHWLELGCPKQEQFETVKNAKSRRR